MNEKIALVTGASRGIGKAICIHLAKKGFHVIGTAKSEQGSSAISACLQEHQVKGEGRALDVTKAAEIEHLISALTDENCLPAVLVNNAGITRDNLLLRMDEEEWDEVLNTNLNAVYRLTKACIKSMIRNRWGRVVNIGSIVGSSGNPGQVNYCAAKAGLIGFSKALAQEVASRGVTVNVVAPGFIDTDMTAALPDMVREELLKRVPMKRLGMPEDIAEAVGFLVSDSANYITGSTIHVNGGMLMD